MCNIMYTKLFIRTAAILILLFTSCYSQKFEPAEYDTDDPKIKRLYDVNNHLNKAFSNKDWEEIYDMYVQKYNAGLTRNKPNKEDGRCCCKVSQE